MTLNKDRTYKKIVSQISINLKKKKWQCLVDDCQKPSINSHLLQKNGILSSISENNHVIETKLVEPFKWEKNKLPIQMSLIGQKNAFSWPIFCDEHDTKLFNEIENKTIDLNSYNTFLLLSYRVTTAEIRKKEIGIEFDPKTNYKMIDGWPF